MGCDIFWHGHQEDRALQDACREYLKRFADFVGAEYEMLDRKVKGNFFNSSLSSRREIQKKGGIEAIFPHLAEKKSEKESEEYRLRDVFRDAFSTEADLNGIVLYPDGKIVARERDYNPCQINFVFNNSDEARIIAIEEMDEEEAESLSYKYPQQFLSGYRSYNIHEGGMYRTLGGVQAWMWFLYIIRAWFVPSLSIGDDYSVSEKFEKELKDGRISIPNDPGQREAFVQESFTYLRKNLPWARARFVDKLRRKYEPLWRECRLNTRPMDILDIDEVAARLSKREIRELRSVYITSMLWTDIWTEDALWNEDVRTIGDILVRPEYEIERILDLKDGEGNRRLRELREVLGFFMGQLWKRYDPEELDVFQSG